MMTRRILVALVLCAMASQLAAQTETAAPLAEFQAKRVKPPKAGTSRRITVQIDPIEQAKALAAIPKPSETPAAETVALPAPSQPGSFDWFWNRISPDIAQAGPGRLDDALQTIAGAGSVATPRLQTLRDIAAARAIPILTSTVGTQVSPALVLAVIAVESAGDADAVSSAGAEGLMQLMPGTAKQYDVADSFVPEQNIAGGVRYLNYLMDEFDGDPILVLAGYNAGPGSVKSHGGVPPFPETRDYVPKVLATFQMAKALCLTPPELISDGCVFATMN